MMRENGIQIVVCNNGYLVILPMREMFAVPRPMRDETYDAVMDKEPKIKVAHPELNIFSSLKEAFGFIELYIDEHE